VNTELKADEKLCLLDVVGVDVREKWARAHITTAVDINSIPVNL